MMLDEKRSERLKAVFENLGHSIDGSVYSKAVYLAVCNELDKACTFLNDILASAYLEKGKDTRVRNILDMFMINGTDFDDEQAVAKIKELMKIKFGDYTLGELENAITSVSDDLSLTVEDDRFVINGVSKLDKQNFIEVCRRINNYIPPFVPFSAGGEGIPFEALDAYKFHFAELDRMNMPLYFFDSL